MVDLVERRPQVAMVVAAAMATPAPPVLVSLVEMAAMKVVAAAVVVTAAVVVATTPVAEVGRVVCHCSRLDRQRPEPVETPA